MNTTLPNPAVTPQKPSVQRSSPDPCSPVVSVPLKLQVDAPAGDCQPPPPITSASVAAQYFAKELLLHIRDDVEPPSKVVVILQDQCYGHRYSRPKTSKSTLGMIVERPERLLASVLGVSAAYVRLGGRHAGALHAPHPKREPSTLLPFRIQKTSRTLPLNAQAVTSVHGTKWMEELKVMCETAERKLALNGKELDRPENAGGTSGPSPKPKLHVGDLYLCSESLDAFQGALGGVCDAVDTVFERPGQASGVCRAFVCIRPPGHHCSSDLPSGFCWLNNVHVGIQYAAQTYSLTHAAIIDFDLHHGDGSQAVTWEHNARVGRMSKSTPATRKTAIGYFSLHDINSYPCEYGDDEKVRNASLCIENAHGQSIWNVHLQPWRTPAEFWDLYENKYSVLLEKTRSFLVTHTDRLKANPSNLQPKAAIFISAGFDASEWEDPGMQRHKVSVPTEFYARFTRDVVRLAEEEGTGVQGRVISVLEGGYSERALTSGVLSHLSGLSEGQSILSKPTVDGEDLSGEISRKLGGLSISDHKQEMDSRLSYDPEWWHAACLSALESRTNPPMPAPSKKPRTASNTYSSPTQASAAKAIDLTKTNRAASGTLRASGGPPRAPSPPPPEVDWATAAHELSKLLIPTNRQTTSCKAEELSGSGPKKERQSTSTAPSVDVAGDRMQLRGRKAKILDRTDPASDEDVRSVRSVSDTFRRKTIADASELVVAPEQSMPAPDMKPPPRQSSRRSSMASVSGSNSGKRVPALPISKTLKTPKSSSSPPNGSAGADGLQVKKPRVIANALKPVEIRTTAGVREPAVPRISSDSHTPANLDPALKWADHTQERLETASTNGDDMGDLTSALKRITLKMPSKEEQDTRTRKAIEEGKLVIKPARKPPAARASKPGTSKKSAAKPGAKAEVKQRATGSRPVSHDQVLINASQQQSAEPVVGKLLEISNEAMLDTPGLNDGINDLAGPNGAIASPDSSTPGQTSQIPQLTQSVTKNSIHDSSGIKDVGDLGDPVTTTWDPTSPVSSGAQANALHPGPPVGAHLRAESLNSDPSPSPTTSPATTRKEKADLPVFTAHGHIPFASFPLTDEQSSMATGDSLRGPVNNGMDAMDPENTITAEALTTTSGDEREAGGLTQNDERSVWEVAETP